MDITKIKTLGELKKAGYRNRSVKEEIRENLIRKLKNKENTFPGILGYEDSVIPDTERALLSRHNILFLGLRGQAKTRMARQMTNCWMNMCPM
jgi:magnesium chelatase subunit I